METKTKKKSREQSFVEFVLSRMKKDTSFGAVLRRADNPATESQAWEHLIPWCDIEKDWQRLPFATVAAAMARAKPEKDGSLGIGKAIAVCYKDGYKDEQAQAKLRRLLACDAVEEVCAILRPLLRLCASRGAQLSYAQLLNELIYFGEKTRIKWAVDFYPRRANDSFNAKP
ncbi:type I-E CRISPR-associated protein Cse2/CasB [bacterium]|nr:type I-E CRISPR-associated protein Cse2/CasB [bacterium]